MENNQEKKQTVLSLIQPTGTPTLGNYLGALKNWKNMSDGYDCFFGVADLHSITVRPNPADLRRRTTEMYALLLALGLDPHKNTVFVQSHVPAHAQLAWILDCYTQFGEASRMTQFKDKSEKHPDNVNVGLFAYPVLMAADILLYGANYVPVGDDQTQHLEFARDIAQRMNSKFGELFVVPEPVAKQHEFFGNDQGLRIKDLQNPTKKMSKSDESGRGIVFLGDDPASAAKKIMSAETDSVGVINFDWDNQPGITNLLQILALVTARDQGHVNADWEGKSSYGDLKKTVAGSVEEFLRAYQKVYDLIDDSAVIAKLEASEALMNESANQTLLHVQQAVGLRK